MTIDTFTIDTSFSSLVPAGSFTGIDAGHTNAGFVKGLDGKHYIVVQGGLTAHSTEVLCAENGHVFTLSQAQFQADLLNISATGTNMDLLLSAPGTPYFWCFSFVSNGGSVSFFVNGILYKVVDNTTVTAVGGMKMQTEGVGPREERYYGITNAYFGSQTINNELFAIGQVLSGAFSQTISVVIKLPLEETVIIDLTRGSWSQFYTDLNQLGTDFFTFHVNSNRVNNSLACIVPLVGSWGIIIDVNQAIYDYVHAHPGINTLWDALTGPTILWFLSTNMSTTDVTSEFSLSDAMTHLDGSSSVNYYDDYVSPNSFQVGARTYVAFGRSYTLSTDLEPIGTFARLRVFLWDGTTATQSFDASAALFDPVVDCGVTEGQRTGSYPQFVQPCYDPSDGLIRFIWYGRSGALNFDYIFGTWALVTRGTTTNLAVTFSELVNPSFTDWQKADAGGLGQDFQSYMETYYLLTDDTMLWMYAPYIYCYVENSERAPVGLLMQPQWDWSDDVSSNKFARQTEVYREVDLRSVAVSKNRVRGKGRALRLFWLSEHSKDFNLLGWGVDVQKNERF